MALIAGPYERTIETAQFDDLVAAVQDGAGQAVLKRFDWHWSPNTVRVDIEVREAADR